MAVWRLVQTNHWPRSGNYIVATPNRTAIAVLLIMIEGVACIIRQPLPTFHLRWGWTVIVVETDLNLLGIGGSRTKINRKFLIWELEYYPIKVCLSFFTFWYLILWIEILKSEPTHVQKLTISKKSTFFVLSSWNLVKLFTAGVNHFHQVSLG